MKEIVDTIGRTALSSKFPDCHEGNQTVGTNYLNADHHHRLCWVGLTLPGMIDEPGCFPAGVLRPQRGPEASQRISFAGVSSTRPQTRSAPIAATIASSEPRQRTYLAARTGIRSASAIFDAPRLKFGGAFRPFRRRAAGQRWCKPPSQNGCLQSRHASAAHSQIHLADRKRHRILRCVRPVFTMSCHSFKPSPSTQRSMPPARGSRCCSSSVRCASQSGSRSKIGQS